MDAAPLVPLNWFLFTLQKVSEAAHARPDALLSRKLYRIRNKMKVLRSCP